MEGIGVAIGLALGWAASHLTGLLSQRRSRQRALRDDRRALYARSLAANDVAYGLVGLLVDWPRRSSIKGEPPAPGERAPRRSANVVNSASAELEDTVRRSRDLAAELMLIGGTEAAQASRSLHTALEEAVLALKVDTPAKLERRWNVLAPEWRSAREAFVLAARNDLGL